jgi:xylulokinase
MFRHEKENYLKTSTVLIVHNYINWYLTGAKEGGIRVMEPADASGTALWNPKMGDWSEKVINALEPGLIAKLPPVRPADKSIGCISKELVDKYGFSPECKIDAGSGDNMYGAVGTGNVQPGMVTISLGTSGTVCSILEEPFIDPTGEVAAYCDSTGNFLSLVCVTNLSNGYNQLLNQHKLTHDKFNTIIQKTPPGNQGRLLMPWYTGERTPDLPLASPVYFGFDLEDFTPEILCRAVLEGHVLNLYHAAQRIPAKANQIRLTGGLSQSDAWCQVIADIFEAEAIPVKGEGSALGAAIHAAWVWLNEDGRAIGIQDLIERFVILEEKNRKKPNRAHREIYRSQKRLFQALSNRITKDEGIDPFKIRASFLETGKKIS